MRFEIISVVALSCALATVGVAQTNPGAPLGHVPKPGQTTELPASAASVGPNDSVITLEGACKSGEKDCVSSISREQFEKMAEAVKPGMTTEMKRSFAAQYAKILAFSDQARALNLEDTERFQEIMKFVKSQILVEALNEYYSNQYSHPTDQQIDDYYKQNGRKFLEANLIRVIIPSQPAAASIKKPAADEQKAYVDKIRQQWVGGADPATLQKEAFTRMGLTSSVPDINLKDHTIGMIPPDQQGVFDLKPGEISQPFTDAGASFIYKMVSEQEKPLSSVKGEIAKTLHDQQMRDKIQELTESVKPKLNDAYFGEEKKFEPAQGPASHGENPGAAPQAKSSTSSNTPHK